MDIIKNIVGSNIDIEDSNGDKIVDLSLLGDTEQTTGLLPSGYTQVEYIQSNSTTHNANYIDTGLKPTNLTALEMKLNIPSGVTHSYDRLFGSDNTFRTQANNTTGHNQQIWWNNTSLGYFSLDYDTDRVIKLDKGKYYIDGELKATATDGTFTSGGNLRLFSATAGDRDSIVKVYYAKVWENDVLVRHFIPAIRNSDNEIGMYDIVNNTFYTNQGTTDFTYGTLPTPNNPVEVKIVTGRQEVNVVGKNLAYMKNGTYTFQNNTGVINDNILTLNSGSAGSNTYISLANGYAQQWAPTSNISGINDMNLTSNGGNYVASIYTNKTYSSTVQFYVFTSSGRNFVKRFDSATDTTLSFTLNDDEHVKDIGMWTASANVFEDYQIRVQLEKGTATEYEAYNGNTYEINLGKNLLKFSNELNANRSMFSYTTETQELVVCNKNASGSNFYARYETYVEQGQTYTISIDDTSSRTFYCYSNELWGTAVSGLSNKNVSKTVPFTFTSSYTGKMIIGFYGNYNNNPQTLTKPMLEKGSQATSYSPFKNFTKNLLDISNTQIGVAWNNTSNTGRAVCYVKVQPNTTYTASLSSLGTLEGVYYFGKENTTDSTATTGVTQITTTRTFTTTATTNYIGIQYNKANITQQDVKSSKVMLEKGSSASPYEEYMSSIELCKIGNYQDRIYKNGNKWYLEKNIGKVVLNGSQNITQAPDGVRRFNARYSTLGLNNIKDGTGTYDTAQYRMCDHFIHSSSTYNAQKWGTYYTYNGWLVLYDTDTVIADANALKTWFTNNPTSIYYVLATPTVTEITDTELITQLNALEQAQLPYGVAHVKVSGDLPTILDLDYYTLDRYITPEDRQALLDGSATIPFRINIIKDGEVIKTLDEYSIVELDYEDFRYVNTESLVIGQFVARKVIGKLDQIYTEFEIEDTELEVLMGVSYNNNTTYYSLGNFLVTKPTTDDVKEKTEFEAMDYTKKFNTPFTDTGLTFPCTALELAQYTCNLCDVELATTSFANDDFIISDNQYVEGDTCRKVMQDIGKLAYSWVRIDWDNKCYIDFDTKDSIIDYNRITNTEYYDLSLQKEVFGPVNRVVIGMRDVEGENAVIEDSESIEENGVTEIQLYDSNITYTPELRLQAIQAATRLFGLTYIPLETNTIGHPWLIGNERIEVKDMNDNSLYTYPWDRTIVYNGHIKSKLVSKADTKTETEYRNYGDLETATRQTRIIVDKQNQTIEALAEAVQPVSNEISGVGSITLENAYEGTLHRLEIKGSISALFPSTTLYPSATLYPLAPVLIVDDTSYELGFTILRYINSSICDLYVYEDGKQWVERNVGVDSGGNLYELPDSAKYIEELPDIAIQVSSSSVISLNGFANANLKAIYLLQNDYTDTFATNVDLVSKINVSPTNIAIQSHKIALEGYTTINGNFWVDLEGNMHARNGTFEGNIMLPNGGRVIGGDGLFSCLAYTSVGRFSNWEILGFHTTGANITTEGVQYGDVFVNAYIPENFTITSAYVVLEVTSVNSAYSDASGDYEVVGTPKDIALLKGAGGTTVEFFYYPYQAVYEDVEYSGSEIPNAFGDGRYTPSLSVPGSVEEVKSIDIKDYLDVGVMNTIFARSLLSPKPVIKHFTPSGGSYTMNNYEELVKNTGVGRLNLFVFGYMSTEEEESGE